MLDFPTSPPAGWYPDPADPRLERWWGGVEWTLDTRPVQAPLVQIAAPLAAAPALVSAGGGGGSPMGGIGTFVSAPSTTTAGGATSNFSAFVLGGNPEVAPEQDRYKVDASWYDSTRGPAGAVARTNGHSTAGLVLSLFGLSLLGIIFSVIGLRRARNFHADGGPAVGSRRAGWGLGLGIASILVNLALVVTFVLFGPQIISYLQDFGQTQFAQNAEPIVATPGDEGETPAQLAPLYVRADYEQAIYDEYLNAGEQMPDGVLCPNDASTAVGSTVTCRIVIGLDLFDRTSTYLADGSITTETVPAVQQ